MCRGSQQQANLAKVERSPTKRLKTRWEPVGAEESEDKQGHTHGLRSVFKDGNQDRSKDSDNSVSSLQLVSVLIKQLFGGSLCKL